MDASATAPENEKQVGVNSMLQTLVIAMDPDLPIEELNSQRFIDLLEASTGMEEASHVIVINKDMGVKSTKSQSKAAAVGNTSSKTPGKKATTTSAVVTGDGNTSITLELCEGLKQRIETEKVRKYEEVLAQRKQELEEKDNAGDQSKKDKRTEKKSKSKSSSKDKSGGKKEKTPTTGSTSAGKGGAPAKSAAKKDVMTDALKQMLMPENPIPVFIILMDWVKNVTDVEFLRSNGVQLDALLSVKKRTAVDSDEHPENILEFGNPSALLDKKTSRTNSTADHAQRVNNNNETATKTSSVAPHTQTSINSTTNKSTGKNKEKTASISLDASLEEPLPEVNLYDIMKEMVQKESDFHDFGFIDVLVSHVPDSSSVPQAQTTGRPGKKNSKHDIKIADLEIEQFLTSTAMDTRQMLIQFSKNRQLFEKWSSTAQIVEIPTVVDEVDVRLYNTLMSKIPDAYTTIPLMCHCLFEQVAMNVNGGTAEIVEGFARESAEMLENYLDDVFAKINTVNELEDDDIFDNDVTQQNNGRPHEFKDGYCMQCGIPASNVQGGIPKVDVRPSSDDQNNTDITRNNICDHFFNDGCCQYCGYQQEQQTVTTSESRPETGASFTYVELCPASIGEDHYFVNGTCETCGSTCNEHHYQDGICIKCGIEVPSLDLTSNTTTIDTKCHATVGGQHSYDENGICEMCDGNRDAIEQGTTVQVQQQQVQTQEPNDNMIQEHTNEEMCSETMGLTHLFENGVCVLCDKSINDQDNLLNNNNDNISLGYCPSFIGQPHEIINNECIHCAQTFLIDPNYKQSEYDESARYLQSRESIYSARATCDATIGLDHDIVDNVCIACGMLFEQDTSRSISTSCEEHQFSQGVCIRCNHRELDDSDMDEPEESADEHIIYCPSSIGVPHDYQNGICTGCGEQEDNKEQIRPVYCHNVSGGLHDFAEESGICYNCGFREIPIETNEIQYDASYDEEDISIQEDMEICPATIKHEETPTDVNAVVLNYSDKQAIQQALATLAVDLGMVSHPLLDSANQLFYDWWMLPGVKRRGMPSRTDKSLVERGIEQTEMMNNSQLSSYVFERALLALNFTEITAEPGYDFKVSCQDEDFFYHIDYLDRGAEDSVIEAAVKARLAELNDNEQTDEIGSSSSNGVDNTSSSKSNELEYDIGFDWHIGKRHYVEEFDQQTLAQVLANATLSISRNHRTEARYSPINDSLLIVSHTPTPLFRQTQKDWEGFVCPDFNFSQWIESPEQIRTASPQYIYRFQDSFNGILADKNKLMFPSDRSQVGRTTEVVGDSLTTRTWILRENVLLTLEKTSSCMFSLAKGARKVNVEEVHSEILFHDASAADASLLTSRPVSSNSRPVSRGDTIITANAPTIETSEDISDEVALKKEKSKSSVKDENNDKSKKKKVKKQKKDKKSTKSDKDKKEDGEIHDIIPIVSIEEKEDIPIVPLIDEAAKQAEDARNAAIEAISQQTMSMVFDDGNRITVTGANTEDINAMSVSYTSTSGLVAMINSQGDVSMSFPSTVGSRSTIINNNPDVTEVSRTISRNAAVIRYMSDGSKRILMPTGDVTIVKTLDNGDEIWTTTICDGTTTEVNKKTNVTIELSPVQIAKQIDPETNSEIYIREDLVMVIRYGNGSSLVQHSDGTRIYIDVYEHNTYKKDILIECPLFFPVKIIEESSLVLQQGNNNKDTSYSSKIRASQVQRTSVQTIHVLSHNGDELKATFPKGILNITRNDGDEFICFREGKVVYLPRLAGNAPERKISNELMNGDYDVESIPDGCYKIDILKSSINMMDDEGNELSTAIDEEKCVGLKLARHRGLTSEDSHKDVPAKYYPAPKAPILPRMFVVRGDGTGFELLDSTVANDYITKAAQNANVSCLPAEDLYELGSVDNVAPTSLKFLTSVPEISSYTRVPLIPNVVKAAPRTLLGQIESPMKYVIYRQFLCHPILLSEDEQTLYRDRERFREWKEQQRQDDINYNIDDPRSEEEKEAEKKLNEELTQQRIAETEEKHNKVAAVLASEECQVSAIAQSITEMQIAQARENAAAERYAKEYREPVQTFTRQDDDGEVQVLKFFTSGKEDDNNNNTYDNETKVMSSKRYINDNNNENDNKENTGFFDDDAFKRGFVASRLLSSMMLRCHPLADKSTSEQLNEMKKMDEHQKRSMQEEYHQTINILKQGVNDFIKCISRIFTHISDPTYRAIDLASHPYCTIVANTPNFRKFAPYILSFLGFQEHGSSYVQVKDDMYLRMGVEYIETEINKMSVESAEAMIEHENEMIMNEQYNDEELEKVKEEFHNDDDDDDDEHNEIYNHDEHNEIYNHDDEFIDYEYEERERKLRQSIGPVKHDKFSGSFREKPKPMKHNSPIKPLSSSRTTKRVVSKSNLSTIDILGNPRKIPIERPSVLLDSAKAEPNTEYLMRESDAIRPMRTSSTFNMSDTYNNSWSLTPNNITLGNIIVGHTYKVTATLANKTGRSGRFQVIQVQPNDAYSIRVLYRPGMIAVGLETRLEVEVCAKQAGEFQADIIVRTEQAKFTMPISGKGVVNEKPMDLEASLRRARKSTSFGKTGKVRRF